MYDEVYVMPLRIQYSMITQAELNVIGPMHQVQCLNSTAALGRHAAPSPFLPALQLQLAPAPPAQPPQPSPRTQLGSVLTQPVAASAPLHAPAATLLRLAPAGPPLARLALGARLLQMGLIRA
jgi:hypothetical protein